MQNNPANNINSTVNNKEEQYVRKELSVHETPKELPINMLRLEVQRVIESYAEAFSCSRDFITSAVFGIVGTLCGKHVTISNGCYRNHPNMWICNVAPSGSNKSSPIKTLMQPLNQEESRRYRDFREKFKEFKRKRDEKEPILNQLTVSDVTPEGLYKILDDRGESKEGLLLYRDEIKGFIDDIGRYHNSGEVSNYLSIWDGTMFSVTRKTQPPMYINEPFLSIMGGIQPAVLGRAFKPELAGVGFVQRWQFVYPDETKIPLYSECALDPKYEEIWNEIISILLKIEDQEYILSKEARQVFIDYYNDTVLRTDNDDIYMSSLLAKLRIQILKWCAVTHVLSCTEGAQGFALPSSMVITEEEMRYSVECMRYFEHCGVKVLKIISEDSFSPKLTKSQVIKELVSLFGKDNIKISSLAEGIGKSHQYVSKIVNTD